MGVVRLLPGSLKDLLLPSSELGEGLRRLLAVLVDMWEVLMRA